MKKLAMLLVAVASVAVLASCSSTKPATTSTPTAQHHDTKGEMDYKGELREG